MGFNKEYRAELQGMSYAYRYAKEHGIEELEKEIKRRGAMEITTKIPRSVVKKAEEQISATTIKTFRSLRKSTELCYRKRKKEGVEDD